MSCRLLFQFFSMKKRSNFAGSNFLNVRIYLLPTSHVIQTLHNTSVSRILLEFTDIMPADVMSRLHTAPQNAVKTLILSFLSQPPYFSMTHRKIQKQQNKPKSPANHRDADSHRAGLSNDLCVCKNQVSNYLFFTVFLTFY